MSENWTLGQDNRLYIDGKTPSQLSFDTVNYPKSVGIPNYVAETLDTDIHPEILSWEEPYPTGLWYIDNNELKNSGIPDRLYATQPYPFSLWYLDTEMNHLFNSAIPKSIPMSSFYGSENLTMIYIPRSVEEIGKIAFQKTGLVEVTISRNCVYEDTSFPENCQIKFYEEE